MKLRAFGIVIGQNNRFETTTFRRGTQIKIGHNNAFTTGLRLWPINEKFNGDRISIGNNNYFNRGVILDACGLIEIGNFNMLGPDIYITDSNHSFGNMVSPAQSEMNRGTVKVGNHCWIGAKAVILKDVTLGDYCVVGAGSVVTKSFPAGSVIAGVPAKSIKNSLPGA